MALAAVQPNVEERSRRRGKEKEEEGWILKGFLNNTHCFPSACELCAAGSGCSALWSEIKL
jgi:hypothetical protein